VGSGRPNIWATVSFISSRVRLSDTSYSFSLTP